MEPILPEVKLIIIKTIYTASFRIVTVKYVIDKPSILDWKRQK